MVEDSILTWAERSAAFAQTNKQTNKQMPIALSSEGTTTVADEAKADSFDLRKACTIHARRFKFIFINATAVAAVAAAAITTITATTSTSTVAFLSRGATAK